MSKQGRNGNGKEHQELALIAKPGNAPVNDGSPPTLHRRLPCLQERLEDYGA